MRTDEEVDALGRPGSHKTGQVESFDKKGRWIPSTRSEWTPTCSCNKRLPAETNVSLQKQTSPSLRDPSVRAGLKRISLEEIQMQCAF